MSIYGHFIEESTSVVALPEDLVSESVILEMKAKQIDLDDFKSASEAVKYICGYYINIIDTEDKVLTEITNRLEKVKNENQLKTLAKDINSKYPEMTKAAYKDYDKSDPLIRGAMTNITISIDNAADRHVKAQAGGQKSASKTKFDREQIYELLDQGLTHKEVADIIGCKNTKTIQL